MRTFTLLLLAALPAFALPQVGDLAPPVQLHDQDNHPRSLADHYGREWVVLAFYPKDFTGGCTLEAQSISANTDKITAAGITVYGISVDDVTSKRGFCDKYALKYTLLADPGKVVCTEYGTLSDRGWSNRVSFIVNPAGIVRAVDQHVQVQTHGEDLVKAVEALRAADAKTALAALADQPVDTGKGFACHLPAGWKGDSRAGRWDDPAAPGVSLMVLAAPSAPLALTAEAAAKQVPAGMVLRACEEIHVANLPAVRCDYADGKGFTSQVTWGTAQANLTLKVTAPLDRAGDAARLLAAVVASVN